MAIDTPARLAILGAGPVGLEAALYARFLGYEVVVYERGDLVESVRRWGHVRMLTPFRMNRTTLGLAAIQAQDASYRPPADDERLTGREWIERYLSPLAATDLVSDHLRLQTTVLAVGKEELLKGDLASHRDGPRDETADSRGDWSFRVLSVDAAGDERVEVFDGVLDCTGVFANSNWLGHGGIPAIGERALRERIEYRLPDILGTERSRYAGKHTLVIGGGVSAATNLVALAELAGSEPATRVTWITRREGAASAAGPVHVVPSDPLPARAELAERANALARAGGPIAHWPRTVVERLTALEDRAALEIELSGDHAGAVTVDAVIANVGFRPDVGIHTELHVAVREGDVAAREGREFLTDEPNYYVLGSKSFGRRSDFLMTRGYEQIRAVFKLIGDREGLDLYASAKSLLRA